MLLRVTNYRSAMGDITADPRFIRGVALFNAGDDLEASDLFEDLFFEGVRDEPGLHPHLFFSSASAFITPGPDSGGRLWSRD
jgi:hypothetical protein